MHQLKNERHIQQLRSMCAGTAFGERYQAGRSCAKSESCGKSTQEQIFNKLRGRKHQFNKSWFFF